MKILILTERFYPEEFLVNDIAAEWQRQGHSVEVLTQAPSYPHDRIFDGYRNKLFQTTREYCGIPVRRVRTVLGYNRGGMKRKILNYISFAFLTSLWALFIGWKYDRVFVYHTGPLSMASAASVLRFIWWRKCMIWTQDIWPDTVYSYGVRPTRTMRLFLNTVVWCIYRAFSRITVSCPGFIEKLKKYTARDICLLPQWAPDPVELPPRRPEAKRVFTFAGNIGSVQNLDKLVRAFASIPGDRATLRFVGCGVYLERLKKLVGELCVSNVEFIGWCPRAEMPKIFNDSDVLIISLKPEFSLTIPAKFQAYAAAGRPIFGAARGDMAALIRKYDIGVAADPGDEEDIVRCFKMFCDTPPETFLRWQKNALALSKCEFCREKLLKRMTEMLIA